MTARPSGARWCRSCYAPSAPMTLPTAAVSCLLLRPLAAVATLLDGCPRRSSSSMGVTSSTGPTNYPRREALPLFFLCCIASFRQNRAPLPQGHERAAVARHRRDAAVNWLPPFPLVEPLRVAGCPEGCCRRRYPSRRWPQESYTSCFYDCAAFTYRHAASPAPRSIQGFRPLPPLNLLLNLPQCLRSKL